MKKVIEVGEMKGRPEDPTAAGHVNAVCKEWLVREDSALAYRLQSEEIHDHYKGNRSRNGQVRQDFPTALQEQIKEKQNAERQAAMYHQMINEQEESDERVARELAEKLEREAELERRRLLRKSEQIARSLQQEQMQQQQQRSNNIANELPIPPRNVNHRINGSSITARSNLFPDQQMPPPPEPIPPPPPMLNSTSSTSDHSKALELNYACLDLPNQKLNKTRDPNSAALYDTIFNVIEDPAARRNLLLKHTPEKAVPYNVSLHGLLGSSIDKSEVMSQEDSVTPPLPPPAPISHGGAKQKQQRPRYSDELAIDVDQQNRNYQKLSPAKYDLLMGNNNGHNESSSSHNRMSSYDSQTEEASDLEALRVLGLPAEELQEMGRRARQERIDEELARKLQDQLMAQDDMSQEEKDRQVALEAQDKELARMLQERERAKAKRAKERARVKKLQREQERREEEGEGANASHHLLSDSYANPRDLVQGEAQGAAGEDYPEASEDNYSNPVDYLRHQSQQQSSSSSAHGKLSGKSIEDLYTQPISKRHASPQRPNHLELKGPLNRPAPAKAHLPEYHPPENIATVIDPTYAQLQPHNNNHSSNNSNGHHRGLMTDDHHHLYPEDPNGSPPSPLPPPYMPIQGTRRYQEGSALNAAREMVIPQNYSRIGATEQKAGAGRTKKNKEKCAQQ